MISTTTGQKTRPALRYLNRKIQDLLPKNLYLGIAQIAYPLLDPARRGSGVQIYPDDSGYCAVSVKRTVYFDSAFKVGRYLFREESDSIFQHLLNKYTHEGIGVEAGDTIIDVGANVGEFTVAVAGRAARVIAIEPDSSPYACLLKNTSPFANVQCIKAALSNEDGAIDFYLSSARNNSSMILPPEKWTERIRVPGVTLATLIRQLGLEQVDFLKVEAEGAEPEVLEGIGDIAPVLGKIAIDTSPERLGQSTKEACCAWLLSHGFEVAEKGWIVFGKRRAVKNGTLTSAL